jgi:hypothetical protein
LGTIQQVGHLFHGVCGVFLAWSVQEIKSTPMEAYVPENHDCRR